LAASRGGAAAAGSCSQRAIGSWIQDAWILLLEPAQLLGRVAEKFVLVRILLKI
jgi:hypothetical protein